MFFVLLNLSLALPSENTLSLVALNKVTDSKTGLKYFLFTIICTAKMMLHSLMRVEQVANVTYTSQF